MCLRLRAVSVIQLVPSVVYYPATEKHLKVMDHEMNSEVSNLSHEQKDKPHRKSLLATTIAYARSMMH